MGSTSDLQKHAGHQVRITGRLVPGSASGTAGTSGTTGSSSTSATAGASTSAGQHLQVESVTMISATCAK